MNLMGCRGCDALQNEVKHLRDVQRNLLDRLMMLSGKPEATSEAVDSVQRVDVPDETPLAQVDREMREEEEHLRRLDLEAEAELQRMADDRKIPVEALRDV